NGNFAIYLPPGHHTVAVLSPPSYSQVGSIAFDVVAGETTDVGALNVETGGMSGRILWNGAPVLGASNNGLSVHLPQLGLRTILSWPPSGNFSFSNIVAGAYDVTVTPDPCAGGPLGQATATVSPGQTTQVDVDITGGAGKVVASISLNG